MSSAAKDDAAKKDAVENDAAETDAAEPATTESATTESAAADVAPVEQQVAVTTSKSGSPATSTAAVAPHAAVVTTAAVTIAALTPHAVAVLPAAATPMAPPLQANPVTGALTEVFTALNTLILPNPTVPPANPLHQLVIEVVRHFELAFGLPVIGTPVVYRPDPVIGTNPVSTGPGIPSADDVVNTPYGAVGAWLLEPGGLISDFGGQQVDGKTLLEPINLVIVDPTSTTSQEAIAKFNANLSGAGFPAQLIHTTGFQGTIDGVTYGQQPTGVLEAFSNNFFLLPDDHARAFGPDPVQQASGFVWTVSASREQIGLYGLEPTHVFTSYNSGRDELASELILSGATLVGIVPLGNAYTSATQTTADHDGYAIVIQFN